MKYDKYSICILCFSLLLLLSEGVMAQNVLSQRDHVFQYVDTRDVPTGILEDYGLSAISLYPYAQGKIDSTNYVNYATLQEIIEGIKGSIVDPLKVEPFDLALINDICDRIYHQEELNPIVLLQYDFNRFSQSAVERGDVFVENEQIREKPNLNMSPYEELSLFAASPFCNESFSREVQLVFLGDLFLCNKRDIENLQISFERGGSFESIPSNGRVSHLYSSDGLKEITIRCKKLGIDKWLVTHFPMLIIAPQETQSVVADGITTVLIEKKKGEHEGGRLQIKFADNNKSGNFQKPLIIVEGFDLYPIVTQNEKENFSLEDVFLSDPLDQEAKILEMGYDIIFLDYNNPLDDIRRNAALFRDVMNYVNRNKVGDEKNVVLGLSMGGVVASYGLRKMELQNIDHETWKFISYDAPHMGANVPVGALYGAYHLLYGEEFSTIREIADFCMRIGGSTIRKKNIDQWINSPAVKQLLPFNDNDFRRHLSSLNENYDTSYNVPDTPGDVYAAFHNEYEKMGLPRKTYNVAFSNGLIGARIKSQSTVMGEMRGHIYSMSGIMPSLLSQLFGSHYLGLSSVLLTSSTLYGYYDIKAMPSDEPYFGVLALRKDYLFGIFPKHYYISRMRINANENKYRLFGDFESGGIFKGLKEQTLEWTFLDPYSNKTWEEILSWVTNWDLRAQIKEPEFCLVPLKSSLRIPYNKKIETEDQAREMSPFDQVYTARDSIEEHITFASHFNSFMKELEVHIPKGYRPQIDATATICFCGTPMRVNNPIDIVEYRWRTGSTLASSEGSERTEAIITPTEGKNSKYFKQQSYIVVDAYFNNRKLSSSDTCYVWIGEPDLKNVEITQLEE